MWIVYAGVEVSRDRKKGPMHPVTPDDVSIAEAVLCATAEDASKEQKRLLAEYGSVKMWDLSQTVEIAKILHCGSVPG